ncbi:NAD(P)-dependent oxidoreductase [Phycisphaera mikurensis]|uniref:Putative oxidoreductase n=1 Tax=Phycisphaera mikurensis (strain NBRC 102666 / KCTC 22515 / FYK2301M01) TaxID=1142394 RepID=I0IJ69_PHYMF|nr:NAD(P)-dependent oxidoreductase [Phycisphaera mikurensis]MBB6443279.1 phosphoglycerate dehydrogenase-like enzyme [Phycisphaera mikurensis]BAM05307.1 putative oxidoreductase [Phycisphaera mikurensis NBRC 102666]
MAHRVIVTEELDEAKAAWLGERVDLVRHRFDAPGFERALAGADGLIVRTYTVVDEALLAAAPRLKVVGRAGVGLDSIDVAACRAAGVEVVHTPDANTQAVVEYVLGLLLDRFRPRTDLAADAGDAAFFALRKSETGVELAGMTLGILGFGRIGKRLGQAAAALGMAVVAADVLPEQTLRAAAGDYAWDHLSQAELLERADVVTLHADGREANRHMIGAAELERLKPGALFVNAARGFLVDGAALAGWLRANPGGSAVLDVHDPEPPPADDPLRTLPNARLLPHLASRTVVALANMSGVVEDVDRVLRGQTPRHPAP